MTQQSRYLSFYVLLWTHAVILSVASSASPSSHHLYDVDQPLHRHSTPVEFEDLPRIVDPFDEDEEGDFIPEQGSQDGKVKALVLAAAHRQRQVQRERDQLIRLNKMRMDIFRKMGFRRVPSVDQKMKEELIRRLQEQDSIPFPTTRPMEERRCFLSNCTVPEGSYDDLWLSADQPQLRLYFPIPKMKKKQLSGYEIHDARLKVFLKPIIDCPHFPQAVTDDPETSPTFLVSVYKFTRPLSIRKERRVVYKRQRLDEVEVTSYGNVWVSLNVKAAVDVWLSKARKNFGLEVSIAHANGTVVNSRDVLVEPDCSNEHAERTCRDDDGLPVEEEPWTRANMLASGYRRNTPYLDLAYYF